MVDVFRKGNLELVTLMDRKLKLNGEVSCYEIKGIITGVQEMKRARECTEQCCDGFWIC